MSGRLVKVIDGVLYIAPTRVAAPGYTIYTADYSVDGQIIEGWTYYADDVAHEDFAVPWQQPTDASNAYPIGAIVSHNGTRWRSTIIGNVWEPGVTGWVDADADIPAWVQPLGAHDAYALDAIVSHGGKLWRSLVDANVWQPGVSSWREAVLMPPSGVAPAPPDWVQPLGAHDAYALDAIVSHGGKLWRSLVDANVWQPGVSSWREAVLMPPSGVAPAPPDWVQPTGAHDAYQIGDRVTHNGQVWTSTAANNVWEPGVYGWAAD